MTTHRFKSAAILIGLVLFGLASFGYAQDTAEQSTIAWFWVFLVILGVLVILGALVFLGFQTVRQQKQLRELKDGWNATSRQLRQDLTQRVERVEKGGRDNTRELQEMQEAQENIRNTLAQTNTRLHNLEVASQDSASDEVPEDTYQREAGTAVQKAREHVSVLARAYREGQPIELGELETPTPSQTVLVFLNLLASEIGKWKTEVVQSGEAHPGLVDVLTYREADITAKLKAIRGESPPSPPPLSVETAPKTELELNDIRNACTVYVAQFQGMLIGYEQGREVDVAEYNTFLPQFITDRLFNGVARCIPFEALPERMDKFLHLVGHEVVPIEVGHTKADSRVHEIQASRQTGDEPGTIVEVVSPGLQQRGGGTIVQKPVVIRGE